MKILILTFLLRSITAAADTDKVIIGSKIFTESYVLGEIAAQTLEGASALRIERKLGMGSTGILFESLRKGAIDLYPDYTGTLAEAILKDPNLRRADQIQSALLPLGLMISAPLGFNNTYALAVKEEFAIAENLHTLSDLKKIQSTIRAGFSYEFMDRKDGFNGMVKRYGFSFNSAHILRMEHSLAYPALETHALDVIEVYSTDAKIKKMNLRVLKDDLRYFPSYEAVWVARKAFVESHPAEWQNLKALEHRFTESGMLALNAEADLEKLSFAQVASHFLGTPQKVNDTLVSKVWQRTREHLALVGFALLFSILVGIPLGIVAERNHWAGQGILLVSGLVQTIPSLALLCFLVPLFGIGTKPALVALCLYSLLPVVLNTYTGIKSIEEKHRENARAFGLSETQILLHVILPLASPTLLAGVKTALIVSIGTATLAALVGAGGYGAAIVSGLALNDIPTILQGAIPAAALALLAHFVFEVIGKFLIPKGLK